MNRDNHDKATLKALQDIAKELKRSNDIALGKINNSENCGLEVNLTEEKVDEIMKTEPFARWLKEHDRYSGW